MAYSKFMLSKAAQDLGLRIVAGQKFLQQASPVTPTPLLVQDPGRKYSLGDRSRQREGSIGRDCQLQFCSK